VLGPELDDDHAVGAQLAHVVLVRGEHGDRTGCRRATAARAASMAYLWPCRPVSSRRPVASLAISPGTGSTRIRESAQCQAGR
jgi:hypothetical protein